MLLLVLAAVGISLVITGVMELRDRLVEAARWASIETAYRNGASIKQIALTHGFVSDVSLMQAIESRRDRGLWHMPHRPDPRTLRAEGRDHTRRM